MAKRVGAGGTLNTPRNIRFAATGIARLVATAMLAGCAPPANDVSTTPRIVSLAPNITEMVCALNAGDLLVGRTSTCNYPTQMVARVPVIGGFGNPSLERLLAVRPTLVLEVDLADETVGNKIDGLGLRRERVPCRSLTDIPKAILLIGRYLDREQTATELANQLNREFNKLRQESAGRKVRPKVFAEIWGDPLTTVGRNSFVSDLIALSGGTNIGDEAEKDYFHASSEWVVSRDPDVILCLYMSSAVPARNLVIKRAGWSDVTAVKTGRVYDGLNNDVILRPSPRVLMGVAEIQRCLDDKRIEPGFGS